MTTYHCEHCEAEFQPDGAKLRCPKCLRTTGLTPLDDEIPARKVSLRTLVGIAAVALAVAGVLWFVSSRKPAATTAAPAGGSTVVDTPAEGTDGTASRHADAPNGSVNSSGEEGSPPTAAGKTPSGDSDRAALKTMALQWAAGAKTDSARVRQLLTGLHARIRPLDAHRPLGRPVLRPEDAAARLRDTTETLDLTGVEAGALAVAALRVLGIPAKPVMITSKGRGKTSLRHRDFGARVTVSGISGVIAPTLGGSPQPSDAPAITDAALDANLKALDAIALVEGQRYEAAAKALSDAMVEAPADQALRFLRGQVTALRGSPAAGLEEMAVAVARAEDAEGRFQLGISYLREQESFLAFQALQRATVLDVKHADAWSALAQLTLERRMSAPEEEYPSIDSELDRIEAALTAIGKLAPGLLELRVQRLIVAGKKAEARQLAVEALNMDPKRSTLHVILAQMALEAGETAVAIRHFERAGETDPDDADPYIQLAKLYSDSGDPDAAEKTVKALKTATERAPHDPELLGELASVYHQLGKTDAAKKIATQLNERFPELPDGALLLAELSLSTGDAEEAVKICEDGIQRHPKETSFYVMLYFVHQAKGQTAQAESVLRRLLKVAPDGRMMLAQQLLQGGQVEAAVQLMEAELKAKPESIQVAITLAQLHMLAGHKDDVKRLRVHVAEKAPADAKDEALKLFDDAIAEVLKQAAEPSHGEASGGSEAGPAPEGAL